MKLFTIFLATLTILSCGVMVSVQVDVPHFERVYSKRFEPPPSWDLVEFEPPVESVNTKARIYSTPEGGKAQEWTP